jgi:hypothetical protein
MQCPHHQHKQNTTKYTMTARLVIVIIRTCLPPSDTFGFCSALVVPLRSPSQQHQHHNNNNLLFLCTRLSSSFAPAFQLQYVVLEVY